MNAVEQRKHRTAVQELGAEVNVFAEAILQRFSDVDQRVLAVADTARTAVGDERTFRLRMADEQRSYVDARDRELSLRLARFERLTGTGWSGFWCRLKWLFTAA